MCDWSNAGLALCPARHVDDTHVMQISQSLQELLHVAFDLCFGEANIGIRKHAAQIMVHIRRNHVESGAFLATLALVVHYDAFVS